MKHYLAIGDCNTNPQDLLPETDHLAFHIHATLEQLTAQTIQMTNIGKGMYTTREAMAKLKDTPIIPDYVSINLGLVDSWTTSVPFLYISYYPKRRWKKYPRKLLKSLKKKLRGDKKFVPRGFVVPKDEYTRNIEKIIQICRERNPNACIVLWTTIPVQNDAERNKNILLYNDILKDLASAYNCKLCLSETHLDLNDKESYLGNVHMSGKATPVLGKEIGSILAEAS